MLKSKGLFREEFLTSKKGRKIKNLLYKTSIYLFLTMICLGILLPFFWMVSNSFKPRSEIFAFPPTIIPKNFTFKSWVTIFQEYPFVRIIFNTIFVAGTYTIGSLFFCSMIGYGFAKFSFPGRTKLFYVVLGTMMIPFHVTIIPLYLVFREIGWMNTFYPLILPAIAPAFGIFFMRQYISTIPDDLLDCARIDGCGEFGIYLRIVIPLIRPALATLGIINFMTSWNAFFWPLIVLNREEMYTLQVALTRLQGAYRTPYELIMTGSVISLIVPIVVFLTLQKHFISGLTLGSLKQ